MNQMQVSLHKGNFRLAVSLIAGATAAILIGCSPPAQATAEPTGITEPTQTPTSKPTATATVTYIPTATETSTPTVAPTAVGAGSGWIVYRGYEDGAPKSDLYLLMLDGSERVNITNSPDFDEWAPAIAPDGEQIVYVANPNGLPELFVSNRDGSDPHKLLNHPGVFLQTQPAWSPDGQWIAFLALNPTKESAAEVYVVKPDGSEETKLTDNFNDEGDVAWSPDGTMLIYASTIMLGSGSESGKADIAVVDIATREETRLTDTPDQDDHYPTWSPDGKQIAYNVTDGRFADRDKSYLTLMDVDGQNVKRLDALAETGCLHAGWSPDGTIVFCVSNQTGNADVFAVNVNTMEITNLTNSPQWEDDAAW